MPNYEAHAKQHFFMQNNVKKAKFLNLGINLATLYFPA